MILNDSSGEHHDTFGKATSNRYGNERDHHIERAGSDRSHGPQYLSRYGLKLDAYGRHELAESLELVTHFVRWALFSLRRNKAAVVVVEQDRFARSENGSPYQASTKHMTNLWIDA